MQPNIEILFKLARTQMPYGKYKGRLLVDLPEPYIVWYRNKGFPKGEIGMLLAELFEIKRNGLEPLLDAFKDKA
ncbi:MAG: hypothetical protein CL674_03115 [Bdellovibrionaceae bacterium]|nr:hypothetical protein [Pseudobdellovibrionaceae bacterium]|tara:strand:+ start:1058 stop:1279 length:222 start_codon:yes stop_codon:yes gene_type:complete